MNKKALSLLLAGVLSASLAIPAFATGTDLGTEGGSVTSSSGTQVWAGIVLDDPDARIKVEVPTLFAFVVNGTVDTTASVAEAAISATDGSLLLPNIKVKVDTPSVGDPVTTGAAYSIQTVGDGVMQFTNYSTKADGDDREGLAVSINGNIKNEGTEISRNYWEYVPAIAGGAAGTGLTSEFKQYTLKINGNYLSVPADGGYQLATAIALDAPDSKYVNLTDTYTNMDATTKLAITGATKTVDFGVDVGGQRGQYKQIEESAKVGTIVWTVSAAVEPGDAYPSAPNNDYLQP